MKNVRCTSTNVTLCLIDDDKEIPVTSYGICRSCDMPYHSSQLHFPTGVQHASWPVVYEGTICVYCIKLPGIYVAPPVKQTTPAGTQEQIQP